LSVIGEALGDANCENFQTLLNAIVKEISVSHHHNHHHHHHHHHHSVSWRKPAGDIEMDPGNGDVQNDDKYIYVRPHGRSISFHYMKYALYLSQLMDSCTHTELS
jgi:hypothetical protein